MQEIKIGILLLNRLLDVKEIVMCIVKDENSVEILAEKKEEFKKYGIQTFYFIGLN